MGTSLSGLTPAQTYPGLIKVTDASAINTTLKRVSDGQGTDTLLELSTTGTNASGTGTESTQLGVNAVADDNYAVSIGSSSQASLDCVGIGHSATATGDYSVAVGSNARAYSTDSIAIGTNSKSTHTSNLCIGRSTGGSLTTGQKNLLIGYSAGSNITTGGEHILIGYQPSSKDNSGVSIAIGNSAGSYGSNNSVCIGNSTDVFVGSVCVGHFSKANGVGNTTVGHSSGTSQGSQAWYNTILGGSAGNAITSGQYNTLVGHGANVTAGTDEYGIAIGRAAVTHSNSIVIGVEAASTGPNEMVFGSATYNAGAVNPSADVACTNLWTVSINGATYNIMLA